MQKGSDEKSSDAFRTISEVADDLDLPQHVLRFWETRFPQIRPLKRAGGRRYYRPSDVTLLRAIRQLLYDEGYTIKGVQRLLKEQGAKGLGAAPIAMSADVGTNSGMDLPEIDELNGDPEHLASAPDMSHLLVRDRDLILDTLAVVDECTRILDALRPATRG